MENFETIVNKTKKRINMKRTITETQLRNIIRESLRFLTEAGIDGYSLLTEGSVDKFIEKTIRAKYPQLNDYFDKPLNEMPERFKDEFRGMDQTMWDKSQNLKFIDFLRIELAKAFDITGGRGPKKFLRGIARIAIGNMDFFGGNSNQSTLTKFKNIVLHIFKNDPDKFDSDLNGLSYEQLSEAYNDVMKQNHASLVGTMNKMKLDKSNYTVVAINSPQKAQQYKNYTTWCITQPGISESNYERYVSGGRRFYFLLQNGFENMQEQQGEGCPFDDYGKSMLSLLISMDGSVDLLTTRWNHANNGEISSPDDDVLKFVQKFTGVHIFDACKPYTRDELRKMGITPFEDVPEMLAQGVEPKEIFDRVDDFQEGFAMVRLNDKWNYINQECKLLSNQWFDTAYRFLEGFARVKQNGKWNFIGQEGKFLSNQWFDFGNSFSEGLARVELNGKWNFVNTEGKFLSNQWFDDIDYFLEGLARVELNGKYNYINTEGKFIFNQWFDNAYPFCEGFAVVTLNSKKNYINQEGKFLSNQWFDNGNSFREGFAPVKLNGKRNYINTEGKFLSNQWFDEAWAFNEGVAKVKLNGKYNYINTEGKLVSNQWFDYVDDFQEGFAEVQLNGKWYNLDTNGNLYNDDGQKITTSINEGHLRKVVRESINKMLKEN